MLWFLLFKLKQDAVIEILGLLGWIIILLFQTDSLLLGIQTNIIFFFFDDCPIGLQFVDARVLLEGSFALQDVFVRTKDFWSFFLRFFLFFGLSLLIFTILRFDVIILLWSIFRILPLFIILQIRRFIFFSQLIFHLEDFLESTNYHRGFQQRQDHPSFQPSFPLWSHQSRHRSALTGLLEPSLHLPIISRASKNRRFIVQLPQERWIWLLYPVDSWQYYQWGTKLGYRHTKSNWTAWGALSVGRYILYYIDISS